MRNLLLTLVVCLAFAGLHAFGCGEAGSPMNSNCESELLSRQTGMEKADAERAIGVAHTIRKEIENEGLYAVAKRTDAALDRLIDRANYKMEQAGQSEFAYFKQSEWNRDFHGYLTRAFESRHIGDHPTELLSQWLEDFYDKVEFTLGVEMCKNLHLSDIKTINACTKPTFKPCTFDMAAVTVPRKEEYRNHFAKDNGGDELYGEIPVISYWATEIGLTAAGFPIPFLASGVEYAMGNWIAPRLSDAIFDKVCSQ